MENLLQAAETQLSKTIRKALKSAVSHLTSRASTPAPNIQERLVLWWPYKLQVPGEVQVVAPTEQWPIEVAVPSRMVCATRTTRNVNAEGTTIVSIQAIPTNDHSCTQNEVAASLLPLWDKEAQVQRTLLRCVYKAQAAATAASERKAVAHSSTVAQAAARRASSGSTPATAAYLAALPPTPTGTLAGGPNAAPAAVKSASIVSVQGAAAEAAVPAEPEMTEIGVEAMAIPAAVVSPVLAAEVSAEEGSPRPPLPLAAAPERHLMALTDSIIAPVASPASTPVYEPAASARVPLTAVQALSSSAASTAPVASERLYRRCASVRRFSRRRRTGWLWPAALLTSLVE